MLPGVADAVSTRSSLPRSDGSDAAAALLPRAYHAVTRGFIVNEVVMRVDPQHRSLGEFLRDEVAAPLGVSGQVGVCVHDGLVDLLLDMTRHHDLHDVSCSPIELRM